MSDQKNKTKVYIDGANVFYTQKKLGWSLDWSKIRSELEKSYEILEWRYYLAVNEDDQRIQKYLKYLNALRFEVTTKKLKKIKIGNAKFIFKANFDVEITADILLNKSKIEEVILFSGDSDFEYLVKKLRDAGIRATIWSSRKTVSWELKLLASKIIYFEDVRHLIER